MRRTRYWGFLSVYIAFSSFICCLFLLTCICSSLEGVSQRLYDVYKPFYRDAMGEKERIGKNQ